MTVKVRFAPSPTGYLHVGNIRMALINWLFARQCRGHFLLRIDDTDSVRSSSLYANAIIDDLQWLGYQWDSTFKQSDRLDLYHGVRDSLLASGRLYPCYETAEELAFSKKRQLSMGRPPIYERSELSAAQIATYEQEGRRPHFRFALRSGVVAWHDMIRGDLQFLGEHLSDPVFVKGDGSYLYQFTSVIDDWESSITHVIRGEDHVPNTAIQLQLFEALNANIPTFAHLPMLSALSGEAFSKRTNSLSIRHLRDMGIEPLALAHVLFSLGMSESSVLYLDLFTMAQDLDLTAYAKSSAKFDDNKLWHYNALLLRGMPFDVAKQRLQTMGYPITLDFWTCIAGNVRSFLDVILYHGIAYGDIPPVILDSADDVAFIAHALTLLPAGDITKDTWSIWTQAVADATKRTGKALYLPLRLALTGQRMGSEMRDFLVLMGHERVAHRLSCVLPPTLLKA